LKILIDIRDFLPVREELVSACRKEGVNMNDPRIRMHAQQQRAEEEAKRNSRVRRIALLVLAALVVMIVLYFFIR
jgi:predicted nucleic acid-binding Zn ribbon protein